MDYRTLGRTGVKVSPLCLGAMMFGDWGNTDHDDSIRIIHRALDAGINFIDTADVYSRGESEEIVGKALAGGRRDDVVLATKVHGTMGDDPNEFGNSRRWIVREVEDSLRRLNTDWIDLYQIHRPEPDTDIDETLGALTDLVRAGQGPLHRLLDVPGLADRRGPVGGRASAAASASSCEQPPYSMLVRGIEEDVLPTCAALRHGRHPVEPAGRRLAVGPLAQGPGRARTRTRADRIPARYDLSLPEQPAQARRRPTSSRSSPRRPGSR